MIQLFGKVIAQKTVEQFVDYIGASHSDNMQYLKRNWQVLNSRASDIEDQVNRAELSGKKKRKTEVEDWLKEVEKLKPTFDNLEARGPCRRLPLKEDPVGKMQYQVKELIEQSNHFNELVLDAFGNNGEPWCPTKLFGAKCKQNLERIWPCLVTEDISNIGIYGMGGVGKTTLAKHIEYHLLKITNYQVLWVTVSQDFSINGLQDKIANFLGVRLSVKDEERERANILREAIRKKGNFVLILDDVWVEFSLERIGMSLGASKCRLILTTRSLEVCNRMCCQRIFEVNTLDPNESWDLFKYTIGPCTELPADIEEIAKSVTQRCDGLPLGIITVAGSMRGVRDICEWRNTLEQLKACSEGHEKMERDVFPILEWSYSRLNSCQRHCFLYCCLYREDEKIPREELINVFICAELMDRRSTRNLEVDQGHTILNHLIRVCLLEETTDKSGNKYVKMHDLIRDMALRITSGKNSLETTKGAPRFLVKRVEEEKFSKMILGQKEEWRGDLNAVSISSIIKGRLSIPVDMAPDCPNLTTLLFRLYGFYVPKIPLEIPSSFFKQMGGLKVLQLNDPSIKQLPDIISDMVNLTALLLSGCGALVSMPPVGKLSRLRILDLSYTQIRDIPEGLERLENLELLYLDNMYRSWNEEMKIPNGTLSELRSLQRLRLDGDVRFDDLEVLNQLELFYGCLPSIDVYNQLINFGKLKHYKIHINELFDIYGDYYDDQDQWNGDTKKQLMFSYCNFRRGSNMGLIWDPYSLILYRCTGMDKCISDVFPILSSPNELSYLGIQGSDEVEFLLKLHVMYPLCPFEKLQRLQLLDLPNFIELFNWESKGLHRHLPSGTFSSLIDLEIKGCKKMRKLLTVQLLQNLQNLRTLDVSDCEELEEIVADDIEVGSGGGHIQSTSSGATNTLILPKLLILSLDLLPQLKNICKETIICDSIRKIMVFDCPQLKRLPLFFPIMNGQQPPSNVKFKITTRKELWNCPFNGKFMIGGRKEWWESLEWDNPNSKDALDPYFCE